jgi:hypothetical protein
MRQPRGSHYKRRREVGVSQQFAASLIEIIDIAVLKIDLVKPEVLRGSEWSRAIGYFYVLVPVLWA